MNSPTVSVIITTYNRPKLLPRAIESVLDQTYDDFECIVVDDASSTNQGKRIVESYDDERLSYTRHESNDGLSAARNTGVDAAEGEFIAFLDDDDEWTTKKLARQIKKIRSVPDNVSLVYSWAKKYVDGEVTGCIDPTESGNLFESSLRQQPITNGSTWLVHREAIEQVGGFDEDMPRGVDGDFLRRYFYDEYEVVCLPEPLVHYHVDHGYERMTSGDRSGIESAIYGESAKFEKFGDELEKLPEIRSYLYCKLGRHHAQLHQWFQAAQYLSKAIATTPTSRFPYYNLYKIVTTSRNSI